MAPPPEAPGAGAPIPLVVIGGWLGAGKTTLVNHLLRHAAGRRIAVLVNDFGDVDIDAELIEGAPDGVLALAGGCLCCSFGDDLVGTLARLARRDPPPDVALIELSGVALPASVVRTARLARGVEVVGTLAVADAAALRAQAADRYVGDTVRQQLREADWVLLNKPDLAGEAGLAAAATTVADAAPQARVLACAAQALPAELVLGWSPIADDEARDRGADEAAVRFAGRPLAVAHHAPSERFDSRSVVLPAGVDLDALGAALADAASGVLRAKGFARDAQGGGRLLQVAGGRWSVAPAAVRGTGRLVVIGRAGTVDAAIAPFTGGDRGAGRRR